MSLCTSRAGHRQRHRAGQNGSRDNDRADDPVVTPPHLPGALGGAVMKPADGMHLAAGPLKQRVVDRGQHWLPARHQQRHDQVRQDQPEAPALHRACEKNRCARS